MLLHRLGCRQDQPQNVRVGRMGRPGLRRGEEDLGALQALGGGVHAAGDQPPPGPRASGAETEVCGCESAAGRGRRGERRRDPGAQKQTDRRTPYTWREQKAGQPGLGARAQGAPRTGRRSAAWVLAAPGLRAATLGSYLPCGRAGPRWAAAVGASARGGEGERGRGAGD